MTHIYGGIDPGGPPGPWGLIAMIVLFIVLPIALVVYRCLHSA